jgi:iduronate 2-sulfatase
MNTTITLLPRPITGWLAVVTLLFCAWGAPGLEKRPNVLFIAADDLRAELGVYGNSLAKTPNLDRLAQRGRLFTRAYCQQALCNPSRASIMTGLRPDETGVHDLFVHFRQKAPDIVTLPQLFKNNGYTSIGIGKIYHNLNIQPQGDPASWSRPEVLHWGNHRIDQPKAPGYQEVPFNQLPATQCLDVPDDAYLDGRIAAEAVKALRELKDQPFFLGVGFWKPHLPYNAPRKYWDLYDRASIPLPSPADWPQGAPALAGHSSSEPRGYAGVPKEGPLPADKVRELRHGYLAGISYLDAQVGKVLDELDRLKLSDNTLVVFWGDNGYQVGEHTLFGKLTNFELDARVPLIIAVPGQKQPGVSSRSLVELVDVYPTVADWCGLRPPHRLSGVSLRPVLDDAAQTVKEFALTQHPRPATAGPIETMGYSLRTDRFRYTEWRDWKTGAVREVEFYDHREDPGETKNQVQNAALSKELQQHRNLLQSRVPVPASPAATNAPAPVPGTVITYTPKSSGLYIGSPSIAVLPNGDYLASHDLFGPKSDEYTGYPTSVVHRSSDRGRSWREVSRIKGAFWSNLFVHRGAAYLMGTERHHGRIVIRRSTDGGITWTQPTDANSGLLTAEGQYHTAPVPMVEHNGRLWRGFEDAMGGTQWGKRYRAMMLSVPVDADLLKATNWTFSNYIGRDATWLEGKFNAWLEGNAVVDPNGNMVDILRVDTPGLPEMAAIVQISKDGRTASFDPKAGFIEFPGGAKKFTIRPDSQGVYWSIITAPRPEDMGTRVPGAVRNRLVLARSTDLRHWEQRAVLLYHPNVSHHGFQYVDWLFEGDDIIAACRTAFDDAAGGANNNHDANYLTFHRIQGYRTLRTP